MHLQIKRLLSIRETYSRVAKDTDLIRSNPKKMPHPIYALAVTMLREATEGLEG